MKNYIAKDTLKSVFNIFFASQNKSKTRKPKLICSLSPNNYDEKFFNLVHLSKN